MLFPGLVIFSLLLLWIGGFSFPFEFDLFGRRIHELESLTLSGGKSLANIVEIYFAGIVGLVVCFVFYMGKNDKLRLSKWRIVGLSYLLISIVYFMMPVIPE